MTEQPRSVYQFFEEHGKFMYENGLISADKYMFYIRYKVYLDFIAQGFPEHKAIDLAAERNNNCHEQSIRRAIKFMTDPDWRREQWNRKDRQKRKNKARSRDLPNGVKKQG